MEQYIHWVIIIGYGFLLYNTNQSVKALVIIAKSMAKHQQEAASDHAVLLERTRGK